MRGIRSTTRVRFTVACSATFSFFLFSGFTPLCSAQVSQEARKIVQSRPSLTMIVYQEDRSLLSGFDIDVVVTNFQEEEYEIRSMEVLLPGRIRSTRPNQKEELIDVVTPLTPGSELIRRSYIESVDLPWYRYIFEKDVLLFLPGKYTVKCVVEYKRSGPSASRFMNDSVEIELEPPLNSIVRGGMLGAVLLSMFIWIYSLVLSKALDLRKATNVFLTNAAGGSVISLITILLLQRIEDIQLPITISVKDYIGGLIVGLFSYKIGEILHQKLIGRARGQVNG